MKRSIVFLTFLLLMLSLLPIVAAAYTVPVYDNANLLTADQVAFITAEAQRAEAETGCKFYFVTHNYDRPHYEYTGQDFLSDHKLSDKSDIIILIVTKRNAEYYYDFYTYGKAYRAISDTEVDYILDDDAVYDNLKGGKLTDGAAACFSKTVVAYNGRLGAAYWKIAIVSFLIALVCGLCACFGVKKKYSMKKKSVDYPLDRFAKLSLTESRDEFTGSFVTRRVISDGGSGSGRGGSFHGGGGGHRGGR